ncbi:MAG TPA: pilus assembly protein N-terminal domain-containing protein [Geobacteraceae bacterium]|nr:pilus assembly protein N-terminal domain-containing protein [Geobacteraceae bacterium]
MRLPTANKGSLPILILTLFLICSGIAWAGIPTQVTVNKSVLLNVNKPVERVSIANPAVADLILITPTQLQLNGLATGSTSLIVWEKGAKPSFFDVNVVGDLAQLDPLVRDIAPKDAINVEYAKDTVILSGKAANQQTVDKVVQTAKAYAPNVLNHIRIDEPQQVVLEVKVAQVDKSSLKKLGVNALIKGKTAEGFYNTIGAPSGGAQGSTAVSGGLGGTATQVGSGTGISGNVPGLGSYSPLDAFTAGVSYFPGGVGAVIQALATKNLAKILAEPNLLVKSGQKGEFLVGSKIPYNIVTSTGGTATTSIYFVDVGIKLNFAPVVQENGLIALNIDPAEVSTIQGTLQVNGYPIIDTRSVKTFAELKDGESLVLGGLLTENTIKTMSKIPILGDIPILGALFRSTSDDLEQKELVFFITPKVVKPMAPGEKYELPTDKSTKDQEKDLKWIPMGD